jgi:hypothetical protein
MPEICKAEASEKYSRSSGGKDQCSLTLAFALGWAFRRRRGRASGLGGGLHGPLISLLGIRVSRILLACASIRQPFRRGQHGNPRCHRFRYRLGRNAGSGKSIVSADVGGLPASTISTIPLAEIRGKCCGLRFL